MALRSLHLGNLRRPDIEGLDEHPGRFPVALAQPRIRMHDLFVFGLLPWSDLIALFFTAGFTVGLGSPLKGGESRPTVRGTFTMGLVPVV